LETSCSWNVHRIDFSNRVIKRLLRRFIHLLKEYFEHILNDLNYLTRYESQSQTVIVKRDVATKLNITLKAVAAKEWSEISDYGIPDNIATDTFSNLTSSDFEGFMGDNYGIIDHEQVGGIHHITMTEEVIVINFLNFTILQYHVLDFRLALLMI